jgi:hypothetical protein
VEPVTHRCFLRSQSLKSPHQVLVLTSDSLKLPPLHLELPLEHSFPVALRL